MCFNYYSSCIMERNNGGIMTKLNRDKWAKDSNPAFDKYREVEDEPKPEPKKKGRWNK